ncbi:hypothetical protein WMF28_27900 [Sorangium sp. So ce590]
MAAARIQSLDEPEQTIEGARSGRISVSRTATLACSAARAMLG